MIQVECFHCHRKWSLASAESNRCPECGWITEVFYDRREADRITGIYNSLEPPLPSPSGVMPLMGSDAFSVSFPEQSRIADAVSRVLAEVES